MAHQSKKLMNIVIVNKSTSDDLSILGLDDIELKFNSVVNVKTFGENVFLIDLSKMTSTACSSGIFLYKDKLKSSYSLSKIVKKINNNVLISPLHICNDKYITVTTLDLISLNEFKQNLYKLSISNEKSILKMHKKSFLNVILYLNEKNEVNINLENFDYFNLENEGNIYPFKVLNEVKDSVILFGNTNDLQLLIDLDFVLNENTETLNVVQYQVKVEGTEFSIPEESFNEIEVLDFINSKFIFKSYMNLKVENVSYLEIKDAITNFVNFFYKKLSSSYSNSNLNSLIMYLISFGGKIKFMLCSNADCYDLFDKEAIKETKLKEDYEIKFFSFNSKSNYEKIKSLLEESIMFYHFILNENGMTLCIADSENRVNFCSKMILLANEYSVLLGQ